MRPADDRRIPGWRIVREYLHCPTGGGEDSACDTPKLQIVRCCEELIRCIPLLLADKERPEDASSEPHAVTHAPEALRYALMSRAHPPEKEPLPFTFRKREIGYFTE